MRKIFVLLLSTLFLISCWNKEKIQENKTWSSINISWTWLSAEVNGTSVKIWKNGISVANLQIWWNVSELSDEDKSQFWKLAEISLEKWTCEDQYKNLINAFWNDYSSCFAKRKPIASCENQNLENSKVNVAIIFDASGSMNAKIWNEKMIDIAKEEVKNYISSLDKSIWWSVIIYWHKWKSTYADKNLSCSSIENIWNFTDKNSINSKISSLNASWWTPIDKSLQEAEKYLNSISKENDQKIILLVSDWKETCDGNPVSTAKKIASNKNTYIDVIWFNVYWDVQSQLSEIASAWWWKYTNVRSRADFQRVFADMQAFTNEVKCWASQASVQLRSAVDTLNTYFTCDYLLHEEQVKVFTNMTPKCSSEIENLMIKRSNDLKSKLESLKNQAEKEISTFEESIDDVLKKF